MDGFLRLPKPMKNRPRARTGGFLQPLRVANGNYSIAYLVPTVQIGTRYGYLCRRLACMPCSIRSLK